MYPQCKNRALASTNEATRQWWKGVYATWNERVRRLCEKLWLFEYYHPMTAIVSRTLPLEELMHISGSNRTQRLEATQSDGRKLVLEFEIDRTSYMYKKYLPLTDVAQPPRSPTGTCEGSVRICFQRWLKRCPDSWITTHKLRQTANATVMK